MRDRNRRYRLTRKVATNTGFTMVEIMVMMAMLTIVSGMVLVSFTGLNEGGALNRSARELGLAIRNAQNMALTVRQIPVGGTTQIPPAVGVQFVKGATTYTLFGDLGNPRNNAYDGASEKISDGSLPRGVRINRFLDANGAELTGVTVLNILFAAPEADMTLTNLAGTTIGGRVDIEIATPSGRTKKITVRTSGQISIP